MFTVRKLAHLAGQDCVIYTSGSELKQSRKNLIFKKVAQYKNWLEVFSGQTSLPFWLMYLLLKWTIRKASLWDSASCVTLSNLSATWLTKHLSKIQNKPLYFPSNNYFGVPDPFEIISILLFTTNSRSFLCFSLLHLPHLDIYPKCATNICSFSWLSYVLTLVSPNIQFSGNICLTYWWH